MAANRRYMGRVERSLPWEPLHDYAKREMISRGIDATEVKMAAYLGVTRTTLRRWIADERIPLSAADTVATKILEVHPCCIWAVDYWELQDTHH